MLKSRYIFCLAWFSACSLSALTREIMLPILFFLPAPGTSWASAIPAFIKLIGVHIQIMTITGRVIKTFQQTITTEGNRSAEIEWNGKDEYGDKSGRGVYLYNIMYYNSRQKEKRINWEIGYPIKIIIRQQKSLTIYFSRKFRSNKNWKIKL